MAGRSVAFDAASSSGYEASLSTYNWTHTIANNPNRILVVLVGIFATGSVTGITFNSLPLTFVRSDTSGVYRSEAWILFNPPVGAFSVAVTLSASLTSIANAQSYYYVNQGAISANNGSNGTGATASASVTTIRNNATVVGGLATAAASGVTSDTNQISRTINAGALGTAAGDDKGDVSPAGSATLQWTGLGVTDAWAVSLVALDPEAPNPAWELPVTQVVGSTVRGVVASGSRPGRF